MNKIIIFSGTTEGRLLSEALERNKQQHMVCVATEFGEDVMSPGAHTEIRKGRLSKEEMVALIREQGANDIIDATHPYAVEVTANIKSASAEAGVRYERVLRCDEKNCEIKVSSNMNQMHYFETTKECAEALKNTSGNILLTTGSKELSTFCEDPSVRDRLYARVLPAEESLDLCKEAGLDQRHVIAMFGPFTKEMNIAMMRQINAKILVTKQSGATGGYEDKLMAAVATGANLYVIGRPEQEEGLSVQEMIAKLVPNSGKSSCDIDVQLVGIGMGNEGTLTVAAKNAIEQADVILGANRMIAPYVQKYGESKDIQNIYLSRDVVPYISKLYQDKKGSRVAILFSGDSGLYSGTRRLITALCQWKEETKAEGANIQVIPGISSISNFAARIGEPYSDAAIESWHGKMNDEAYPGVLVSQIRSHERTYVLLSVAADVPRLGNLLKSFGLYNVEVTVGGNLSYENELIEHYDVEGCVKAELPEGLYLAMIKNPSPKKPVGVSLPDEAFIRDKVPMTKAEIRHLSVAKLHLEEGAVVYDVGAGTGSVSIEIAKQHESIRVYAIEKKPEAVNLIHQNIEHLHCGNLTVVEAFAPDGFEGLPTPTHAFIGGSSGNLEQIVDQLVSMNPKIRIVMNAITIETVGQMSEILKKYDNAELVQISAAKNKQAGNYTLMEGQNPVYIASFGGK